MTDAAALIVRRTTILWIATGLCFVLILTAASTGSIPLLKVALAYTAVYALAGIAFGIWAGRTVSRRIR